MTGSRLWQIAGWTMLHYSWVGAALGTAILLLRPGLRSASANVRYSFALGSLLLLSITPAVIAVAVMHGVVPAVRNVPPPVDSIDRTEAMRRDEMRPTMAAVRTSMPPGPTAPPVQSPEAPRRPRLLAALNSAVTCLPWLWVFGTPLCFLLTTAGLLGAERLRRQSRPVEDTRITKICRRLASTLRISCSVGVAICDRLAAPVLIGVLRPMILLPAAALAGWDRQQLEMVLLHELAHVRRYDNLVNLLQRIVESVLFFQPMVWVVSGWVRREREHCCDELVVAHTRQPRAYAEIVVALAERLSQSTPRISRLAPPQAALPMAERSLVARVRRILKKEEQAMQVSRKAASLTFAGLLAVVVAIGGYYSLPSYGGDSSAQVKKPAGEATDKARTTATGDVIEGVVVNQRGETQPGMDVWTVDWKTKKSAARSGPDGRFRLVFPGPLIGEFSLLASNADGTRQGILTAMKLGPDRLPLQQVVLKPSRTLHVETIDKHGNPVAGAPIYVDLAGGMSCHVTLGPVLTDARGRARLAVPEDAKLQWIAAFKAGMGMDYVYLLEDDAKRRSSQESAKVVKFVLNGAMRVSVRLRDSLGRAVAGVQVAPWELWKKGHSVFFFRTASVWAVSDAQGEVQFDFLPADLEKWVSFSIKRGDYYYPVQARLPMKDAGARSLEVTLPAPAQIGGKVTYPDGRPATGIMIEAEGMGSGATRDWARTAKDGTYRLQVHPDNSYIIAVVDDQWAAASRLGIVLKEGDIRENLDFQLNEGTLIHGIVPLRADMPEGFAWSEPMLLQYGLEIPDEWKSSPLATPWGDGQDRYRVRLWRSATPDATGHYAFRVGPGEYELLLPGIPGKTKRFSVTNQREIMLDGPVPKLPPPLRGIVVDRAGKPVPDVIVTYEGTRQPRTQVGADKDGRFSALRIQSPGCVYAANANANLAGFRAISEAEHDVTIVMDKGATVVGRVVDASGRPIPGMRVVGRLFAPQPDRCSIAVAATTDKDGMYRIAALLPGWHGEMTFSRLDTYEAFKGPQVMVQPGENNLGDATPKDIILPDPE